jgi:hypothetical protein
MVSSKRGFFDQVVFGSDLAHSAVLICARGDNRSLAVAAL